VTLNVSLVGARNAYKWNGLQACGAGDLIAGQIYRAVPLQALNGGVGGFVIDSLGSLSAVDVNFIIDGGGAAITTGQKGQLHIPFPATVTSWRVMADQGGSIVVDILRANNTVPTVSMIGGGNKPTLTAQQFNAQSVSGWGSTVFASDDWFAFNVTSAATVTRVTVELQLVRL
jgi:hypothetical protein